MADEEEKARLLALPRPTGPISLRPGIYGFFGEYRWLSNFHESPFFFDGMVVGSVENVYQAQKALYAGDFELSVKIGQGSPAQAKRLGKTVKALPLEWDQVRLKVMRRAVVTKFSSDSSLLLKLLATGDLYLDEANWWRDRFWGTYRGVGENNLGKILMEVRGMFR